MAGFKLILVVSSFFLVSNVVGMNLNQSDDEEMTREEMLKGFKKVDKSPLDELPDMTRKSIDEKIWSFINHMSTGGSNQTLERLLGDGTPAHPALNVDFINYLSSSFRTQTLLSFPHDKRVEFFRGALKEYLSRMINLFLKQGREEKAKYVTRAKKSLNSAQNWLRGQTPVGDFDSSAEGISVLVGLAKKLNIPLSKGLLEEAKGYCDHYLSVPYKNPQILGIKPLFQFDKGVFAPLEELRVEANEGDVTVYTQKYPIYLQIINSAVAAYDEGIRYLQEQEDEASTNDPQERERMKEERQRQEREKWEEYDRRFREEGARNAQENVKREEEEWAKRLRSAGRQQGANVNVESSSSAQNVQTPLSGDPLDVNKPEQAQMRMNMWQKAQDFDAKKKNMSEAEALGWLGFDPGLRPVQKDIEMAYKKLIIPFHPNRSSGNKAIDIKNAGVAALLGAAKNSLVELARQNEPRSGDVRDKTPEENAMRIAKWEKASALERDGWVSEKDMSEKDAIYWLGDPKTVPSTKEGLEAAYEEQRRIFDPDKSGGDFNIQLKNVNVLMYVGAAKRKLQAELDRAEKERSEREARYIDPRDERNPGQAAMRRAMWKKADDSKNITNMSDNDALYWLGLPPNSRLSIFGINKAYEEQRTIFGHYSGPISGPYVRIDPTVNSKNTNVMKYVDAAYKVLMSKVRPD